METFTVRDLRERTDEVIRNAEERKFSIIVKDGVPLFVAVPFDDTLQTRGLNVALAISLFDREQISLSCAARMANRTVGEMIDLLHTCCISVIRTTPDELERELGDFG